MQKFKTFKTNSNECESVEREINELIEKGAKIESITPITTKQYKTPFGDSTGEVEILIYVLYQKEE